LLWEAQKLSCRKSLGQIYSYADRMRILGWAIIVLILLPFVGLAGFLLFSMAKNAVEDARQQATWRAWIYHVAFVVFLIVVACVLAYLIYLVVSVLLGAQSSAGGSQPGFL
jgi:hypothetical protein